MTISFPIHRPSPSVWALIVLSILFSFVLPAKETPKKYIFASWELGDVTPQEILAHADKFDRTGCDGLAFPLRAVLPGADAQHPRRVTEKPIWTDRELDTLTPVFTELFRHPSMRHSFFFVNTAPRTVRFRWDDNEAWGVFAENMAAIARFARKVGADGIITDFEDYWKKRQYHWTEGDPPYDECLTLARRRGREVFKGVFDAFPDIAILSFHLFSDDWEYPRVRDPEGLMLVKRDLFPAFLNGLMDVMPPEAKLVDGFERAYGAKAAMGSFYRIVHDQKQGVLPLVAPENRAKYKLQHSVSFGLFMDAYSDLMPTNSIHYLGPVRGRRIVHLEENIRQATECADEYVWFWGQKGFWIDWPEDLKDPSWRDGFKLSWRRKYFNGKWGRIRPWNDTLDGNFDLVLRGVKDPDGFAREEYERLAAAGTVANLGPASPKVESDGRITIRAGKFPEGDWYGVALWMNGGDGMDDVWFRYSGKERWKNSPVRFSFGRKDAAGRRFAATLLRVPIGCDGIYLRSMYPVADKGATFDALTLFKIGR